MFYPLLFVLFSLTEIWNDFQLIIKIFVLMTIISFVRNHLGTGPLSWVVIGGFFFFIFGDLWKLFGTIYVMYMLLVFGVAAIFIDFFFVTGGFGGGKQESPVSSGADLLKRRAMMGRMQAARPRGPFGR